MTVKVFNITTLVLFVCFLFAPTITFALDQETPYSLILNEEEEVNSKNKSNNTVNEEEEKEVKYYTFENFKSQIDSNSLLLSGIDFRNLHIKDELVFKIPLPPPEHNL